MKTVSKAASISFFAIDHSRCRGKSLADVFLVVLFILMVIALLLPLLNRRRTPDVNLKQRAQLSAIDKAIELFNSEFELYPPSDAMDEAGAQYCGAMKLCEAVMGQDLLGFHPKSVFRSDGTNGKSEALYPDTTVVSPNVYKINLSKRKGPYLPLDNAMPYSLADLYGQHDTGPFNPNHFVLCDVWRTATHQVIGQKVGMPILYYKADASKTAHDVDDPNNPENIYDYRDNHALLALGVPGKPGVKHPLYEDPKIFYEITRNDKVSSESRPSRADAYVLLSAGRDGLYGTKDDVANFEFKWKRD
ncbi:MAG: hypothetical protein ACYSWO_29790 [Planctomycetota bacterium]|jgi:hypothetical protein